VKKRNNGRKSLRRLKPTVGCNASKRRRRRTTTTTSPSRITNAPSSAIFGEADKASHSS
jgi:hypothetical protein